MAKRLFAITAPLIKDTGTVSYRFIVDAKAPRVAEELAKSVGTLSLEERGKNEVDPFKLMRGEPGAVGPTGIKRWKLSTGSRGHPTFFGAVDESPNDEHGELRSFLKLIDDSVLLMPRDIFDRFEVACKAADISLAFYHCEHELSTS